ncbi:hypothetical protein QYE76_048849 [Lolium multiflorum]|uniref:CCHC-type domain-containing protein n=1 Tax=Lolium multiflorum TaxID=4521 RepID=A0AAD8SMZ9_LOLMU|nr:hypothetical protein QYE76_048849 [Lolium multiflorum]
MLKSAEIEIKKEHQVLMVNKTTSFKKQGKSKGKFKKGGKKAATPPVKPKTGPKPDAECYYCKEKGHWKRNCSKYLADLKSGLVKKKKEGKTMEVVRETLQALELPVDRDSSKSARPSCKWQKPPMEVVKINSDGAIREENSSAATGVVARDAVSFCGALGKVYEGISDPLIAEALALRDAAVYAVQKDFTRVVFEVDCVDLARRWHGRLGDRSMIRPVLDEVSELLSTLFSYSIIHTRREANQAAHSCAKFASIQDGSFSWEADPPGFLKHSLRADCNSMIVD